MKSIDHGFFNNRYFSEKQTTMKAAEILLRYMDELQKFVRMLNGYIDQGLEFLTRAKEWVETVVQYIEQAIDSLVKYVGGRKTELKHMNDDYMFV